MGRPGISIAMCTYNGARYLQEQLESIAGQTRLPDELIICDDHSSDHTGEVIEQFALNSPFPVRLHVNEKNMGVVKNFERAITFCQGDIIALSDQDDVWHPDKLMKLEAALVSQPEVGLVFSDAELVDENLQPLGHRLWQFTFGKREQQDVKAGRAVDVFVEENAVTGATMAFWSRFKKLVLPIPVDTFLIHDGWIALVIATVAKVDFIPEPLIKYRQHEGQQIGAGAGRRIQNEAAKDVQRSEALKSMMDFYLKEVERHHPIRERLLALNTEGRCRKPIAALERKIARLEEQAAHFHSRARMPKNRLGRLPVALRELFAFRYHRYSNGFYSFTRDLLS